MRSITNNYRNPVVLAAIAIALCGCGAEQDVTLLTQGMQRIREGNYKEAIEVLRKADQANPNNAHILCNLGIAYYRKGDHPNAMKRLKKAAELAPNEPEIQEFLGQACIRAGNWSSAISALAKADQIDPGNPRILTTFSVIEFYNGDPKKAETYLMRAMDKDPQYAPAIYNMAVLYRDKLKNPDVAAKYFRKYLEVAQNDAHANVARDYLKIPADSGQPVGQQAAPKKVIEQQLAKVKAAIQADDSEEALLILKDLLAKYKLNSDVVYELASLYEKNLHNEKEAIKYYTALIDNFPKDKRVSEAQKRIAALKKAMSEPGNATPSVEKTKPPVTQPGQGMNAKDCFAEGFKKQTAGDLDGAITLYNKASDMDKTYAEPHLNLGTAYRAKGMTEKARDEFAKAVAIKPSLSRASLFLAVTYHELNDNTKAIEQLNKLIRQKPDYAEAHKVLSELYAEEKDPEAAKIHLERYNELAKP